MARRKTLSKDLPPLPPLFLERMRELLKEDYPAFFASYETPPNIGLRVNTLKITVHDFRTISPYRLAPLPWCTSGFVLQDRVGSNHGTTPGKHPYHLAGLYYLQDPSSMLPPEILNPSPDERVLDLAAAPGGKTTHLSALLQNQGLLVANEIHPTRVRELVKNLERCGVRNTMVTNETPERLATYLSNFFDKVLVDAPCSGEGMFRKNPETRWEWKPESVQGCATRQRHILESAAQLVRPGGYLLYSTCTFSPEENEGVIARFLSAHPEFEIVKIPWREGYLPGRPDWVKGDSPQELSYTIRLMPHRAPGEGNYSALLRKSDEGEPGKIHRHRIPRMPDVAKKAFWDFCQSTLSDLGRRKILETGRVTLIGTRFYLLPPDTPAYRGLRVIHPGWWLGRLTNHQFEPSHALVRGLTSADVYCSFDLSLEDTRLEAYLHGEAIPLSNKSNFPTWVMVTLRGYPLGWGRVTRDILKSCYPRGLRVFA